MAIRSKDYLKDKFQTGRIPSGQDFADFIETFISTVNGMEPDEMGEVKTAFVVIDPMGPDISPQNYPVGSSEFFIDYVSADYADYIAENPSFEQLQDGMIRVRTSSEQGITYQQVDNIISGLYQASFVRVAISPQTWGELRSLSGPRGEKGDKGDPGEVGSVGPAGPAGPEGPIGLTGNTGSRGATGPEGPIGPKGDKGDTGLDGNVGPIGPIGPAGPIGPIGNAGPEGPQGPRGEGIVISKTYESTVAAYDDIANIPDMTYVSIAGPGQDNGTVFFNNEGMLVFQFQAAGIKGERGDRGLKGDSGSIKLVASVTGTSQSDAETKIPGGTFNDGDSVWVTYPGHSILYTWTSTVSLVGPNPGFYRGPNLIGQMGMPGLTGPRGDKGDTGTGINILGSLETLNDLPPTANDGDSYWYNFRIYTWNSNKAGGAGYVISVPLRGAAGVDGQSGSQGPQGIQGPKGDPGVVEGIGTAELLTNAKTIREAINENFTNGNNVKSNTVSALLSKYPEAGVTNQSSWDDIDAAIRAIPSGGVVGRELTENQLQINPVAFGDFVKKYTLGAKTQVVLGTVRSSYSRGVHSIPMGDDSAIVAHPWNTENFLSIRHVTLKNDVTSMNTTNVQVNGTCDYVRLAKISDTLFLVCNSLLINNAGGGAFEMNLYSIATGTPVKIGASRTISTKANVGLGFDVQYLGEFAGKHKVMFTYSGTNDVKTVLVNTLNIATSALTEAVSISLSTGTNFLMRNIEVGRNESIIRFVNCSLFTTDASAAYELFTYSITNNNLTSVQGATYLLNSTESRNNSSLSMTLHRHIAPNGKICITFLVNNSGSNNSLLAVQNFFDPVTFSIVNGDRRIMSVTSDAGSGSTSTTQSFASRPAHSEVFISDHELFILYRTNALGLKGRVLNLNTLESYEERTLFTGTNNSLLPLIQITKNGEIIQTYQSGALNSTSDYTYSIRGYVHKDHVKKATGNDIVYGVLTEPSTYPSTVKVIRPPLT